MRTFCTDNFSANIITTIDFVSTERLNNAWTNDSVKLTISCTTGFRMLGKKVFDTSSFCCEMDSGVCTGGIN